MSDYLGNAYSREGLMYSKEICSTPYDPAKRYLNSVKESLLAAVEHAYFNHVVGDIVEFGTGFGLTANILAYSNKVVGTAANYPALKKILLFDSFEGLPKIESEPDKKTLWKEGEFKALTPAEIIEVCSAHMAKNLIEVYPGWFKDSLNRLSEESKFSVIHIDCDLYASALDVLANLFGKQRVSAGAIICFDDFNCHKASPAIGERRAFGEICEKFNVKFESLGGYSSFGHKFMIHDYAQ